MDNQMQSAEDITLPAGRSAAWNIVAGGWQTVVRLGVSAVLARVLDPEDFGIFGVGVLIYGLISQVSLWGATSGLIAKQDLLEDDVNTCFWTVAISQVFLFAIGLGIAPVVGLFFHIDKVVPVVRAISLSFLFAILGTVPSALLEKELRFGAIAVTSGLSVLLGSSASAILAWSTDLRYWALVIGMLLTGALQNLGIFVWVRWVPRFRFSKRSFRYLFRFGANSLGFSITNYFHQNIDYILVGRLLGATSLGFYQFAYKIPHMIQEKIAQPIGSVVFPALARMSNDDKRLGSGYIKSVRYIALITFPALGGLAILADMIILTLWGEKWLPIVIPFRILCVCAAIRCIMQPLGSIFYCKDRPDIVFRFGIARLFFSVGVVVFLGYLYNLNGVAVAMVVSTFPSFWILGLAFRMTRSSLGDFLFGLLVPLTATALSMFCAYASRYALTLAGLPVWGILCLSILGGVVGYVSCIYFLFRGTCKEVVDVISNIIGRTTMKDEAVKAETSVI